MRLLLCCLAIGVAGAYYPAFYPDLTSDQPFICEWRSLAWEFAKKIQPTHDARLTFDALMLGSTCKQTRPSKALSRETTSHRSSVCDIFVAVDGNDAHTGTTAAAALRTAQAGLVASRKLRKKQRVLCIGGGTFYLSKALELTPADSGLTIQGSRDSWLSGASRVSQLDWKQYEVLLTLICLLDEISAADRAPRNAFGVSRCSHC